jgi:hypothetical protein
MACPRQARPDVKRSELRCVSAYAGNAPSHVDHVTADAAPLLRAPPSRAARRFRRKTADETAEAVNFVSFGGLPRSPFPLATPVSPTGRKPSPLLRKLKGRSEMTDTIRDVYSRITGKMGSADDLSRTAR